MTDRICDTSHNNTVALNTSHNNTVAFITVVIAHLCDSIHIHTIRRFLAFLSSEFDLFSCFILCDVFSPVEDSALPPAKSTSSAAPSGQDGMQVPQRLRTLHNLVIQYASQVSAGRKTGRVLVKESLWLCLLQLCVGFSVVFESDI